MNDQTKPTQHTPSSDEIEAACKLLMPLAEATVSQRMVDRSVLTFLRYMPAIVRNTESSTTKQVQR